MMLASGLFQAIVYAVKGQTFFSGFCREYVDRRFGLMWSITDIFTPLFPIPIENVPNVSIGPLSPI